MAIYDTMQHLRAPVNTICMGMAASMGSFLLAAGAKGGKRSALPHSRIMIHQPSGGAQGTASDIEIQAREILYLRSKMNSLRPAYRPADRDHRAGHGPGSLHERGRGQIVRDHRQRVYPAEGPGSAQRR